MPNNNKPSTEYHQGAEQLSRILLHLRSRTRSRFAVEEESGITDTTELLSNHQGQCSEESRRLLIVNILTQALELADQLELLIDDSWGERNN
jgi:hypothetical protein